MPRPERRVAGLLAVAATYVFFLLWAQFGFLELLQAELPAAGVQRAMAAMGLAGLAASFLAARALAGRSPEPWVAGGLAVAAAVAVAGARAHGPLALTAVAAALGAVTAVVTVTLASGVRGLLGERSWALGLGAATGAAYLVCNVPALFEAAPELQSAAVAALALAAAWALRPGRSRRPAPEPLGGGGEGARRAAPPAHWASVAGVAAAVSAFLLLVWIDAAAFAVIQGAAALKGVSWGGASAQWAQGLSHLLGALTAGWWIQRGRFGSVLIAAWGLFATALPALGAGHAWAAPLYAVGISAYSVALVAYPSLGPGGAVAPRWRAAWVFGIAGWVGSALGVGMAQDLGRIVPAFVLGAGLPLVLAVGVGARPARLAAWARLGAVPAAVAAGALLWGAGRAPAAGSDPVARGRAVYVAEGCIHCHSQYVRPGTADVLLWGPARPLDRGAAPVLVGNRRQGPDLANVGNRRGRDWQRLHLEDPRSLVAGSTMPSYRHLFAAGDDRGERLLDYLDSLGAGSGPARWERIAAWRVATTRGAVAEGRALFAVHCAVCHGEHGRGDGPLAPRLRRPAMDLRKGEPVLLSTWGEAGDRTQAAARLIRFGAPGTPMPGHELLTDAEVADLVALVLAWVDEAGGRAVAAAAGGAP